MDLSVIIPCKKEARNIAQCVKRVAASCPNAEILVVDSGLDDTKVMVEQLKIAIPHLHYFLCQPDRGKGDAIRQGIQNATRNYLAQIDADLQFRPEELPKLLEPLLNGEADMTLGCRFSPASIRKPGSAPLGRTLGNRTLSGLCSLLFRQNISDGLAGMKAWRRAVTDSFTLTSYTYSYEIELFARAIRKGWKVKSVPVTFEMRKQGVSTVSVFKAGFNILKDIFIFRFSKP